ncbi:hypothetical protein [Corallococcus exercitus]|uniref:DUF4382 domain-containing protein n=1 Tax=Corallococcus exercitus TaxID=2316736 RepID=A0A7Y4JSF4_9BACT|nr:hypothetical protein [Corallococcus exercitus]NOK10335.1 hypothetical protein [Corallococcus exercitus]
MKPFFIAAALSLGLCSCSESAPVVQILQVKLPDKDCKVSNDSPGIANGSLNLAYGRSYVLAFIVNNAYTSTAIDVNGVPLEPGEGTGGASTAVVDTLKLSYETTPNVSIPDGEVPYTAGLAPASEGNTLVANLLTREARDALVAAVSPTQPVQVRITVQFTGKYASGHKKFESNEIVYTVDAYTQDVGIPACGAGTTPDPIAPCGSAGGQDGNFPSCM